MGVPEPDRDELRRLADLVVHREDGVYDVPRAGMEAALVNLVDPGDVVVIGVNGVFGERMCDVAGRLGVPFVQDKLTRDPAYNVQLGSQYLTEMLGRFGGSYELALAAYNAGPNRVARWLETMGDPRNGKIDMVDWIEMIPFSETRNYVQRIMEGVVVYRDRLNGPFNAVPPATGRS